MREILFRGKRVDNGEWAYGYYAESHRSMNSKIKPHKAWIVESFASNGGWLTPMIRRAIYDETVGQYTGLKDVHGTRIFEGDVCKAYICKAADTVEKEVVGVICFEDGTFEFKCEHENIYLYPLIDVLEVIGNVYDNQEILKGEREKI